MPRTETNRGRSVWVSVASFPVLRSSPGRLLGPLEFNLNLLGLIKAIDIWLKGGDFRGIFKV